MLTSATGRETFLAQVDWEDDWPIVNGGQKIPLHSDSPHLYELSVPVAWRDDFSDSELQLGWYRKNTPVVRDYSLTERPGYLRLYGGPYNLSVPACPTLFLRKQTHRFCTWGTRLSFHPRNQECEAGAVVWWTYFTYSSIGIRRGKDGQRIVRLRSPGGEVVDFGLRHFQSDVRLVIECGDSYRFGFQELSDVESDNGLVQWIGEVDNSSMTAAPPVGVAFTGMMLGLYAFGERQRCLDPADFHYAQWK